MDYKEEQDNEVEALEAIFSDELEGMYSGDDKDCEQCHVNSNF